MYKLQIIMYNSKYMKFWKRQSYGDREKISGSQGFREMGEGQGGGVKSALRVVKLLFMTQ